MFVGSEMLKKVLFCGIFSLGCLFASENEDCPLLIEGQKNNQTKIVYNEGYTISNRLQKGYIPVEFCVRFYDEEKDPPFVKIPEKFDTKDCSFILSSDLLARVNLEQYKNQWFPWLNEDQFLSNMSWKDFVEYYVLQSTPEQRNHFNYVSSEPYSIWGATVGGLCAIYASWEAWKGAYSKHKIETLQDFNNKLYQENKELKWQIKAVQNLFKTTKKEADDIFYPRKTSTGGSTEGSIGSKVESYEELSPPLLKKERSSTPDYSLKIRE